MICTSVKSGNILEIIQAVAKYPFVEIRLDDFPFSDYELEQIFKNGKARTIATCRNSSISDLEKFVLMEKVIKIGVDIIDLEIDFCYKDELIVVARRYKCEVIVSEHNYATTPTIENIINVAELAKLSGADYFKIATKCNSAIECLTLLNLYVNENIIKIFPKKLISLPIGNEWKSARITALSLGTPFIYVSSDEGDNTAEGQITFGDTKKILEIFR